MEPMQLNIVHFRDEATRTWLWVQWLSFLLPRPSWSRTYSRGTANPLRFYSLTLIEFFIKNICLHDTNAFMQKKLLILMQPV